MGPHKQARKPGRRTRVATEPGTGLLFTKILATLGPASGSIDSIESMIAAGARAFRINFSHGTLEEHAVTLANVRAASERVGEPIAVVGDLCGPKMRLGQVVDGGVTLATGTRVEFSKTDMLAVAPAEGEPAVFSTTYSDLVDEVQPGQRVLLDDGKFSLTCIGHEGDGEARRLLCEVLHGGTVTSRKGINLPDTELSTPALTDRDRECARFAVEHGVDFLALSFVRSCTDVAQLRDFLRQLGVPGGRQHKGDTTNEPGERPPIPVISKIEKPQALDDLEGIILESEFIMVARGDLGVEMDVADVPVIQKQLIRRCHEHGRPVIVATQMLESMIAAPNPTRAEVSDVANAIIDGADVVMLSGETAVGQWPVEAVRMMNRVATRTNDFRRSQTATVSTPREKETQAAALAHGVASMTRGLDARLVVLWAEFDDAVIHLSQSRLGIPILACCSKPDLLRRVQLLHGVKPVSMDEPADPAEFLKRTDVLVQAEGWAGLGDSIIYVYSVRQEQSSLSNLVYIHQVGSL